MLDFLTDCQLRPVGRYQTIFLGSGQAVLLVLGIEVRALCDVMDDGVCPRHVRGLPGVATNVQNRRK